ncbi:MAG: glutamate--tRNA ligase [bacterium]|nr:glutamate--tRNA ligase [bacterium]
MRVRFAPSPTGFLHIGNARTAVANFLIAKKSGAELVLRIEDTDKERSSKESELSIMNDLKWLGIEWNEGPDKPGDCGPYRQSERFDIYQQYTEKLLSEEKAYRCYCSQEELDEMRKKENDEKYSASCPGNCRVITEEQLNRYESEARKPVIRFKVPENETITIKDNIKGDTVFNSDNIGGDFIIVRSDGSPIYNYIVIIDDALMKISHVIRGEDHLSNTPKQVLIARALDLPVPEYAHLALVLGSDRSKLSKRHGITSVDLYRKEGYLPESLINYLSLLGWATESGEEILSLDEIIKEIELTSLAKSAAVFDFQKLMWMNGQYIRNYPLDKIIELFIPYIQEAGFDTGSIDRDLLEKTIEAIRGRCEILSDISKLAGIFLNEVNEPDEETDTTLKSEEAGAIIRAAKELLDGEITEANYVTDIIPKIKEKTSLKGKKLFHPIRAMLSGRLQGPEMDVTMEVIGYEACKKRIEYCFNQYCV